MALSISTPSSPDDFALMPHTRAKLEAVLDGTVKFPGNGVSALLLYGVYGSGKTTMAKLLPGWLETVKTTPVLQSISVGAIIDSTQPNIDFHSCAQGQNGATLISQIQSHVMTMSFNPSCLHYVILDEVDNLTAAAHASLKAIMNYTHVVFVLTTNFQCLEVLKKESPLRPSRQRRGRLFLVRRLGDPAQKFFFFALKECFEGLPFKLLAAGDGT